MMREAICVRCERPFEQKVRKNPSPYCGNTCRAAVNRANRAWQQECPECNKMFTTYEPEQQYCSRSCGTTARAKALGWKVKAECVCQQCGITYKPKAACRVTFCSRECSQAYDSAQAQERAEREQQEREERKKAYCKQCGTFFHRENVQELYCSNLCRNSQGYVHKTQPRPICLQCGKKPVPGYNVRKPGRRRFFCSPSCRDKAMKVRMRTYNKALYRAMKIKAKEKRKKAMDGAERFHPKEIFERDGWTCQLCSKPINRDVKCPHPQAASMDHIVPVADGGMHTRANAQCAHFRCNSLWQAKRGKQMRLFA